MMRFLSVNQELRWCNETSESFFKQLLVKTFNRF